MESTSITEKFFLTMLIAVIVVVCITSIIGGGLAINSTFNEHEKIKQAPLATVTDATIIDVGAHKKVQLSLQNNSSYRLSKVRVQCLGHFSLLTSAQPINVKIDAIGKITDIIQPYASITTSIDTLETYDRSFYNVFFKNETRRLSLDALSNVTCSTYALDK